MVLPKLREIKEALTSFFSSPVTTKFPAGPYTPSPAFRGMPRYSEADCVGCGTCAQVCPSRAIEAMDDPEQKIRMLKVDYGSCIQCGQCQEKCITGKGIENKNWSAPAVSSVRAPEVFETVRKELVLCEGCGAVIGCRDHLAWIMERLGAKAYAHPNFLLLEQRRFGDLPPSRPKDRLRREDQIKQVCAKCRQKIVTLDEF